MNLAAQKTPLIAALEQLGPHDHFCSIYESPQEHYAVAIPFIQIGLDRGEKCIYIADDGTVGDVRQAMQSEGIDVDRAIASKALVLATKEQAYLEHGSFHPDWMFTFWKEATQLAMSEGFSALRATGETEWVLRGGRGLERWMEYESRLTHTLSENNCSALCQYNRRLFPPELILDVIRTHPTVVYGSTVCRNLYYVPPDEFLGTNQTAREVDRLLTNIRERERVEDTLREQLAERRRAEEELRRSEAYLAEGQKISHTGSWGWNVATGELFWSQEHFRIFGFDPKTANACYPMFLERIHPKDRPFVEQTVETAVRERSDLEMDYRIVLADGSTKYLRSLGHPLIKESSDLVEFVGTVMDVTERKRAEEALRESEERWRAVFENSAIGVALTDLSGRFLATNSAYQKMLGYTEEEICKLSFLELTHEDYRDSNREFITELFEGKRKQFQIEKQYWRKDGSLIWVSNNVSLVPGTESMPRFIMALSEDITERKLAEEALRKTQAELAHVTRVTTLGEMTASIAHEINQPLGAVVNNASACLRWLAGEAPNLEEARQSATLIIADGHRASEIIGRIRTLVKKSPPRKDWLDINQTVLEVIALARSEAQTNGVSLQTQLLSDLPLILGDRVQLQQVILNLIINAIEAMSGIGEGPRTLRVGSGKDDSQGVRVTVRDSGPGIDPDSLDHLFTAFYTTKPQGMGMGLAISRTIIEAHGGRLWAVPNDGPGATFQFTLPKYQKKA